MASIRKTAPGPLAPVPFNISRPFRTKLANGFRVVVFSDDRVPLVSYRLAFFRGDAHDSIDNIGLTSAMTSMLTEGTENYSSRELAEKIERLGAGLSTNASVDFTAFAGSALSIYGDEILELMAEVLFRPTFPESELDLYKRNALENLKFQRSQPNFLANEQTARILYADHPYAIISPKAADFEKLERDSLVKFHASAFRPQNAVLIVVGDVEIEKIMAQIEEEFGDWPASEVEIPPISEAPPSSKRSLTIVDRPGSAQANIVLANIVVPRNHPDYFAIAVMNQVLGAGASSRVFMNLREEKGYTYGAYTRFDSKRFAGEFEATAEVRTAVTGDSLKEFFYELNRIRDEKVLAEELDDAKNYLTGVFPIRAETQEGLTGLIVSQLLYDLPEDYLETYRANIGAITIDEVQRVANAYIHPDELAIIIVGDAKEILPQVKDYSDKIEVFDTEGKQKDN
ncbi:MAG: M16 family metallopeptidase [Pyrinomonadaceae bacterium]